MMSDDEEKRHKNCNDNNHHHNHNHKYNHNHDNHIRAHASTHLRDAHLVGSSRPFDVGAPSPAQDEGLEQVVAEALAEGRPDAVEHVGRGAGWVDGKEEWVR